MKSNAKAYRLECYKFIKTTGESRNLFGLKEAYAGVGNG